MEGFEKLVCEEDVQRWKREGRKDILDALQEERVIKDSPETRAIIGEPPTGKCRFLNDNGNGGTTCAIYATRPKLCRDFKPGSAKICPLYHGRQSR